MTMSNNKKPTAIHKNHYYNPNNYNVKQWTEIHKTAKNEIKSIFASAFGNPDTLLKLLPTPLKVIVELTSWVILGWEF